MDITENGIKNLSEEEAKKLTDVLLKNFLAITEIGKKKFDMTDDEMEVMKVLVIKQFLKEAEEKEKNDASNP
ncbi:MULTISPECIES: hypothetical protein [Listeria]|uniref:hypothetical protein n=1 Tax=Listeria TaxID=1637 RepID=UPI001F07C342|nr:MULTISPECIES: hypothetical protein [Listeria]